VRTFWILLVLLAAAALVLWFRRDDPVEVPTAVETAESTSLVEGVAPVPPPIPAPLIPPVASTPAPSIDPSAMSSDPPPEDAASTNEEDAGDSLDLGLGRSIESAVIVPGRIVREADGVLVADDRYRIEGEGTEEKPYRVSWELLVSAGESYRPRVGDRGIPQRIAMLDGAWVAIEGYVAFPMLVGTASEALVMLNRWDGCCIGVPPSPYDAVEVKLRTPVVRTTMHAIDYGVVTGKLIVEPYLVDQWLVGLYLMEDAALRLDL